MAPSFSKLSATKDAPFKACSTTAAKEENRGRRNLVPVEKYRGLLREAVAETIESGWDDSLEDFTLGIFQSMLEDVQKASSRSSSV